MLVETARRVGEKFGARILARARREEGVSQRRSGRRSATQGYAASRSPRSIGGSGLGMTELAMAIENAMRGRRRLDLEPALHVQPDLRWGHGRKVRQPGDEGASCLPALVAGRAMFAMALTEPDAGSNTLEMKTFARPDGNGWRINGQKIWITAVPQATKILVVARTQKIGRGVPRRTDGISLFMIDREREGLAHQPIDKLGTNTLPSSAMFFDDVRVEGHELVGTLDQRVPPASRRAQHRAHRHHRGPRRHGRARDPFGGRLRQASGRSSMTGRSERIRGSSSRSAKRTSSSNARG